MTALRIAALGLAVLAAALSGCSKPDHQQPNTAKNTSETQPSPLENAQHLDHDTRFLAQPHAQVDRVVDADADGRMEMTIAIFSPERDKTKLFHGSLGVYDQATFEKGRNVDPLSPELLYVISLDNNAGTIIAVHYANGEHDSNGTAYVFKRPSPNAPYALQWWLFGQTSKTATDLDTYMTEKGVSLNEALRALHADAATKTPNLDSKDALTNR